MTNPTTVSIARALTLISRTKGKVSELTTRAKGLSSWIEGQELPFQFEEVNAQRLAAVEELLALKTAVAKANACTTLEWKGTSLTIAEALFRLSELKGELSFVSGLTLRQGVSRQRLDWCDERTEIEKITYVAVMTEPERVACVEALREDIDALQEAVNEANYRKKVKLPR